MYQKSLGSCSGPLPVAVPTALVLLFALEAQAVLVP